MYKLLTNNNTHVLDVRVAEIRLVPICSDEYKLWLAEGNTPEPAKSQEEIKAEARATRLTEIDARLSEIDKLKVRPLSELILDPASEFARDKLTALEIEADALRAERTGIL